MNTSREEFEKAMRSTHGWDDYALFNYRDEPSDAADPAFLGWLARDAEVAAKDARIKKLEQALRELPNVVPRTARGEITVRVVREYIEEALR